MTSKFFPLLLIVVIVLIGFFYPKNVGGPLCGPVCPSLGLHYWEKDCIGFRQRYSCPMSFMDFLGSIFGVKRMCTDVYADYCFGLPIGEKRCYGVPYTERENLKDRELNCDYPCNDEDIRVMCQTQENITFGPETHSCEWIRRKCNW